VTKKVNMSDPSHVPRYPQFRTGTGQMLLNRISDLAAASDAADATEARNKAIADQIDAQDRAAATQMREAYRIAYNMKVDGTSRVSGAGASKTDVRADVLAEVEKALDDVERQVFADADPAFVVLLLRDALKTLKAGGPGGKT